MDRNQYYQHISGDWFKGQTEPHEVEGNTEALKIYKDKILQIEVQMYPLENQLRKLREYREYLLNGYKPVAHCRRDGAECLPICHNRFYCPECNQIRWANNAVAFDILFVDKFGHECVFIHNEQACDWFEFGNSLYGKLNNVWNQYGEITQKFRKKYLEEKGDTPSKNPSKVQCSHCSNCDIQFIGGEDLYCTNCGEKIDTGVYAELRTYLKQTGETL